MTKLPEPEDLQMLRHRFSRTIEMWVAYNTFLNGEVLVGDDKICIDNKLVEQTTHTLLIAYYSFIFSLFDPSAVNFKTITEKIIPHLPQDAIEARDLVLAQWANIEKPLTIIRNNIGFHHSAKQKGASSGYHNYNNIHPLATELIMNGLRVFFRRVDGVYDSKESYGIAHNEDDTVAIMEGVRKLNEYIVQNPHEEVFKSLRALFNDH